MRCLLIALAVTQALAQLTVLPLSTGATDAAFGATVNATYGYLAAAQALFLSVNVTTNSSLSTATSIGYFEVDLRVNATHTQAFQFTVSSTGLCSLQALLNHSNASDIRIGQNPSKLNVTVFASPSSTSLMTTFQIAPFNLSTSNSGVPSMTFSVGPRNNDTQCNKYLNFPLLMIAQPAATFAPFAAGGSISRASSGCVYGSPAAASPFSCMSCFGSYMGPACDWLPVPVNTTLAPTNMTNATTNMTTVAPQNATTAPMAKSIITITLAMDISAFNSTTFASDVASLMNISSAGVVIIQYYAGSVVVVFYFTDAVTAAVPAIAATFVTLTNASNTFTKKYSILAVRSTIGEPTTIAPSTTAAVTDNGDDSGISKGQIAGVIIVVLVIVIIIVVAIVVYVKRSKDTPPSQNRGSAYGGDAQNQQMSAIGATTQPQKPGVKTAPAANKPSYDI